MRTVDNVTAWGLRTLPKDVGVALVVGLALALGLLLRQQVDGQTRQYNSASPAMTLAYPAGWRTTESNDGALLRVENPRTDSAYKSNISVESRELDPSSPPTLQELVDRRIVQHGGMTGYHLLSSSESTIGANKAMRLEYAYVVQPIDTPRSASLPVVVHSREYIFSTKVRSYYFTLAAPEEGFAQASEQFDRMVETARIE